MDNPETYTREEVDEIVSETVQSLEQSVTELIGEVQELTERLDYYGVQ